MARFDNAHSRFVAWAKVAAPLLALAILSTVFLIARPVDPKATLPYSAREIDEMLRDQRLSAPAFAGVTEDGAALTIGADVARPDPGAPDRALAEGLSARIELPAAGWLTVSAGQGAIDKSAGLARFDGGVQILSETGYDLRTQALTGWLDQTRLESDDDVVAVGPPGRIEAGRVALVRGPEGAYVLDFTDRVRLVYTPRADP